MLQVNYFFSPKVGKTVSPKAKNRKSSFGLTQTFGLTDYPTSQSL
jgi:hypothetical protein